MADNLQGKRVLVTGASGRVGIPVCKRLVRENNEVWGICRFSDPAIRQHLDENGVNTRVVELVNPDFSQLPEHFDHIVHFGGSVPQGGEKGPYLPTGNNFHLANQVNGVGTGKLMARFRNAQSCLITSTTGVYERRSAANCHEKIKEDGRLGPFSAELAPYSSSKNALEVVALFCAQEFGLATTIARLGAQIGPDERGMGARYVQMVASGMALPVIPGSPTLGQYIHDDDIYDHLSGFLSIASTNPEILNWTSEEVVDFRDLVTYLGKRLGRYEFQFVENPLVLAMTLCDTSKLIDMVGPCKIDWKEAFDRVIDELMPDCPRLA